MTNDLNVLGSMQIKKEEILDLKCQFVFRNVGQGLFYTGKIGGYLLVYDCGSSSINHIKKSIEEFQAEVKSFKLDLFVISHFDNDHINGISKLSEKFSVIDTVVIPYIDPATRLLIMVNNPDESSEYYDFLVDPITYLTSHFIIKQLIILRGDSDYKGSDYKDSKTVNWDPSVDDRLNDQIKLQKEFGEEDKEFRNMVEMIESLNFKKINSAIYTHNHDGYLHLNSIWKFSFYNYNSTDDNLNLFIQILKNIGIDCFTKDQLRSIVQDKNKRLKVYKSYRDFIEQTKKNSDNILNVNNTSLVLLHGPMNEKESRINYFHEYKRDLHKIITSKKSRKLINDSSSEGFTKSQISIMKKKISTIKLTANYYKKKSFSYVNNDLIRWRNSNKTILFGDLNVTSSLKQIQLHFGNELSEVTTLLVPHHGSKNYWNQEFIQLFNNHLSVWVTNYGITNSYGHPDPGLVEQLRDFRATIMLAFNNEVIQIRQHMDVNWLIK